MEITVDEKRRIIGEELATWEAEGYRLELRHRVQTRLGNERALQEVETALERVEVALEILREELAVMDGSDN